MKIDPGPLYYLFYCGRCNEYFVLRKGGGDKCPWCGHSNNKHAFCSGGMGPVFHMIDGVVSNGHDTAQEPLNRISQEAS